MCTDGIRDINDRSELYAVVLTTIFTVQIMPMIIMVVLLQSAEL